ncbi:unnamed protein product [Brachionus calyciflorus]|uniref:Spindle and centriole-associated protein 1 n=1 Tax=Brachionus calyciflorus TaxID=104777 RepID=A0A813UDA8_9BILA|nr:unnamed protein product [Brachionus calyciflorus]
MSNVRKRTPSTASINRTSLIKVQNSATKKVTRTKPAWDATNSDLSQHKATNDEIERRKASCKSKNIDLVKFENQKKELLKSKKSNDPQSQLALLKEILFDDEQVKNLIMKSDSTLKVVKDFFEEDDNNLNLKNLNKKQAKINLTLAPNVTDLNESNLPHNKINEKKSNIVQAKSRNLNDSDNEKQNLDSDGELNELALKIKSSNLSLKDLKQVLNNFTKSNNEEKNSSNAIKNDRCQERKDTIQDDTTLELDKNTSLSLSSFNDELKKALANLENKINDFEKHIGKHKNADSLIKKSSTNNVNKLGSSSYTLTLIQIVSNLIDYLRDAVIELNYEKLKQAESCKQLDIHRKLIDGLTTEVLIVKEQNEKITNNFMAQNAKISAEMDQIKLFLKTGSLNQNNFIHSIEPRMSAFSSQPQLNMFKPIAQQIVVNHEERTDKFSQRLNDMLQYDLPSTNLLKSTSVSQFQNLFNKQIQNHRPLSANFNEQNNFDVFNDLNKIKPLTNSTDNSKPLEFNTQIDLLKNKSLQVQQRLKQLQQEHRETNSQNSSDQSTSSLEEKNKLEALERVKHEQQLLKEQINLLNKQRETAQQELEILSSASPTVIKKDKNYIQNALLKHLEQFSFENSNENNGTNTPGLSPIRPELNQDKMSEIKNLEITPTRNDHRIK